MRFFSAKVASAFSSLPKSTLKRQVRTSGRPRHHVLPLDVDGRIEQLDESLRAMGDALCEFAAAPLHFVLQLRSFRLNVGHGRLVAGNGVVRHV